MEYDVVIAGAGPAGAQCARDVAARGHDVAVLETESEAEFPKTSNKSTGGTFPGMMASFGVPDHVVQHFTDQVVLESPSEHFAQDQPGAVLDFGKFKEWLVADGRERGAEYIWDARARAPITDEDGDVIGVEYNRDEEIYADIVIDATGPAAPLAQQLEVLELKRERQAIGIEWECEGVDLNPDGHADLRDAMMLRLDHDLAPGGYSWIFHTGEDTAKVGLCYIQNDRYREQAVEGRTIDGYLEHWMDTDPRLTDAEKLDGKQHRGSAHIQLPGSMTTDSFMAIGDTVPTIDPLWGEGIHQCMKSGRAAAITADHCLTLSVPDTSAERIALYEDLWHEQVAPNMRTRMLMTELMYLAPNERYDRFMRDMKHMDTETLARANDGEKRAILKLLHLSDLPFLVKFAREWYNGDR